MKTQVTTFATLTLLAACGVPSGEYAGETSACTNPDHDGTPVAIWLTPGADGGAQGTIETLLGIESDGSAEACTLGSDGVDSRSVDLDVVNECSSQTRRYLFSGTLSGDGTLEGELRFGDADADPTQMFLCEVSLSR